MDSRDIQDFKHFVQALQDKVAQKEKFFTLKLATRLANAAKHHPEDVTIVQMTSFLTSRASKASGTFISRAELQDVYKRLYTTNTKCASLLSDELMVKDQIPQEKQMVRPSNEGIEVEDLYSRYADQRLVNEFESAFDKSSNHKQYRKDAASRAEKLVKEVLTSSLKVEPTVKVVDGRDFAIICQATYETPKGQSHILVPVEVKEDKAFIPTMFVSKAGLSELKEEEIKNHIVSTAGKNFKIDVDQLFQAIKVAKFGPEKEGLNDVERVVMAFKARTGTVSYGNEILFQEVDKVASEINTKSEESESFAQRLGTVGGLAEFTFGKDLVEKGRSIIASGLSGAGYKHYQIKVAGAKEDSITYSVSVAGSGFNVPVKVEEGKVKYPKLVIANGIASEFSVEGIKEAISHSDISIASEASGFDQMNSQQLIGEVEKACYAGDTGRAGEVISAISLTGDETAMTYAFAIYMSALDGTLEKKATKKIKTIKLGGNEVCAETFLPVNKVYLDKSGNISSRHRMNSEHTDDVTAAGMMNAKILMGL